MMDFFKATNSQGDSMLPDYDHQWVERNPTVYRSPIDTLGNRREVWERTDKSEYRLFGNDSIPTGINTRSEESTEELWERTLGDDYRSGDHRETEMIEFRVSLLEEDDQELCKDLLIVMIFLSNEFIC